MHFLTEQEDATTIFRLREERLDSRNAGQLKAEFLILAQPDIDTLIVDLTDVVHIDSAGLSALLLAQRQMRIHEGELRLVGLHEDVRSLLAVTQLDRIFPIFDTVSEALAAEPTSDREFEEDEPPPEEAKRAGEHFSGSLGHGALVANEIRAGAVAAGGLLGATALTQIIMTPYDEDLERVELLAFGDEDALEEEDDDDFDELDDFDDDEEDEDDDLDEEDDVEDEAEETKEAEPDELVDDLLEDDDWDDEELEDEDEEDDF
jgi:anti-anti-sigma factor